MRPAPRVETSSRYPSATSQRRTANVSRTVERILSSMIRHLAIPSALSAALGLCTK